MSLEQCQNFVLRRPFISRRNTKIKYLFDILHMLRYLILQSRELITLFFCCRNGTRRRSPFRE